MQPVVAAVIGAAAVVAAVGVLLRAFHIPDLIRGTRLFLLDWQGEPARPGFLGRPSFPERMTKVEDIAQDTSERTKLLEETTSQLRRNGGQSVADKVHSIDRHLEEIKDSARANRDTLGRLDQRVTDHRRRNEEQIEQLREFMAHRMHDLQTEQIAQGNKEIFNAIMHELGVTPPPDRRGE